MGAGPGRITLATTLVLSFSAVGSRAQPPVSPAAAPEAPSVTVEELARLVQEQRALIERQAAEIEALRQRLAHVEQLALGSQNEIRDLREEQAAVSVPEAVEERLARLEESAQALPELSEAAVREGEFPGSLRIPGTDAAFKVGGRVHTTAVQTFDALGSDDRFITSSIPIEGTEEAGKGQRVNYSAAASKLNLDFRTRTGAGYLRAFIEGDFAGTEGGRSDFRLRHAFGQWWRLIIGQTWSTFADPEAEPDGIDFEGLNAISLFRQPQIRWTFSVADRFDVATSLEDPAPDVTNAGGVSQVPDLVARMRFVPHRRGLPGLHLIERLRLLGRGSHVHAALLVRQIRAEPPARPNDVLSTPGWGLNLSGRLYPAWWEEGDSLTFALYAGEGIGRYITDLGTLGGQDAFYDPVTDTLTALPVAAGYVGYQHAWRPDWRSTLTYGTVEVDNLEVQPLDSFHRSRRTTFNLGWSPTPRLDLIAEFLWGERINKNGQRGRARQLQLGTRFHF